MISLLIWLLLGLIAGSLAKFFMPGDDGGGLVLTTILGILGAVVGGFMGRYVFGLQMISSFDNIGDNLPSFIFSIIGAILILAFYRLVVKRSL